MSRKAFRIKSPKIERAQIAPAPDKPTTITGAYQRITEEQRVLANGHVARFYQLLSAGRLVPSDLRWLTNQIRSLT